ncbi:hypothetical protein [Desulfosarcina sp.]|uniref:hypothetical protein n=1 Tax=Desulfosarcina sp. TaxID=2027861 RepID=UPI0039707793
MILNPAIITLIGGSWLISAVVLVTAGLGVRIILRWDLASTGGEQLAMERQTCLISSVLAYLMCFELLSLFLFVFTADRLHSLFTGAMCAAGSLNVNAFGYPTLALKLFNFLLCGIWLVVNHVDQQAEDYPLIDFKYKWLAPIAMLLILESFLVTQYFRNMQADVITSCCGALFSEETVSVAGAMASLPAIPMMVLFYLSMALTMRTGIHFLVTGRAARWFSTFSVAALIVSLVAIIAFISIYIYQLPTHHCPFDILQREYGFIGYPLYLTLLTGGICGAGVGVLARFQQIDSLSATIPAVQKKLCAACMIAYILFVAISGYPIVFTDFSLEGY